jgi:hypothetical protein
MVGAYASLAAKADDNRPEPDLTGWLLDHLDAIPGAYESALDGRRAVQAGRVVRLEDL